MASSFIANDDIHFLKALVPDPSQLAKLDAGIKLTENVLLLFCFWVDHYCLGQIQRCIITFDIKVDEKNCPVPNL